jgi:hypothetical protein
LVVVEALVKFEFSNFREKIKTSSLPFSLWAEIPSSIPAQHTPLPLPFSCSYLAASPSSFGQILKIYDPWSAAVSKSGDSVRHKTQMRMKYYGLRI